MSSTTDNREVNMNTDRCDRCGAEAKARFVKDELELFFCGHHGREYGLKLVQSNFAFDYEYATEADPELVKA